MVAAAAPSPTIELVDIHTLRRDPELQLRAGGIDDATRDRYAELLLAGEELPPVVAYVDDEGILWLADGWHRAAAAEVAGIWEIRAELRSGSRRDALVHAAGANARHGLPMSNADKRRAVGALLDLAEQEGDGSSLDTPDIARRVGVTPQFVNKLKRERREAALVVHQAAIARLEHEAQLAAARAVETVSAPPDADVEALRRQAKAELEELQAQGLRYVLTKEGTHNLTSPIQTMLSSLPFYDESKLISILRATNRTRKAGPEPDPLAERRKGVRQDLHRLQAAGMDTIPGSDLLIPGQLEALPWMHGADLSALAETLHRATRLEEERRRGLLADLEILQERGAVVVVGADTVRARPDLAWSTRLQHLKGLEESVDRARHELGTMPPKATPPAELVLENPRPVVERPAPPEPEPELELELERQPEPDPRQVSIPLPVVVPDPVDGRIVLPLSASQAEIQAAIDKIQKRAKVGKAGAELAGRVWKTLDQARRMAEVVGLGLEDVVYQGCFWTPGDKSRWGMEAGDRTIVDVGNVGGLFGSEFKNKLTIRRAGSYQGNGRLTLRIEATP